MDVRVWGALAGFTLGFVGYIAVKIWVMPIRRYCRLKADVKADIESYKRSVAEQAWNNQSKKRFKHTRKKLSDLKDCYDYDIPVWYRIALKHRNESPQEAAKYLMDLANIREGLHALKRLEKAQSALLLKPPKGIQNS